MKFKDIRIRKVKVLEGTARRLALKEGLNEHTLVIQKVSLEVIKGSPTQYLQEKYLIKDIPADEGCQCPCPKCGTTLAFASGIGEYCPNHDCDVSDGCMLVCNRSFCPDGREVKR